MKTILAIAAIATLVAQARADWKGMKPGMDYNTVVRCAGVPLLEVHGKAGFETWTYDNCGYIQFQYGRVIYFEQPKLPLVRPAAVMAKAAAPAKSPAHVVASKVPATAVAVRD